MSDPAVVPIQQTESGDVQTQPSGSAAATSEQDVRVDLALHDAFMLGWQIAELRSRLQIALYEPADSNLRLASLWHAGMNRIAALHSKAFPDKDTANSLYDPPAKEEMTYLYPPEEVPDYADIGIAGKDTSGTPILANFRLYDVTRRAINCLALIYFNETDSLTPDTLANFQRNLVDAVLSKANDRNEGSSATPEEQLKSARKTLTDQTVKFLNAWHGYLREHYYVGGKIPDDSTELVAYEAGHYLSLVSWGISVATVPLEQQCEEAARNGKTSELAKKFVEEWQKVFRVQAIVRLQHQVTALSTALDDAYYHQHREKMRPADNAVLVALNPDLPSQAIQAVKRSIDYWQRAVKWIADNEEEFRSSDGPALDATRWSKPLRLALSEQANIWQTLMTGQQSLRAYTVESVTQEILQDVMNGIQQNVRTDFSRGVKQAEQLIKDMSNEAQEVIKGVGKNAVDGLGTLYKSIKPYLWWVIGGIAVVFIFVVVAALANPSFIDKVWAQIGAAISTLFTAVMGSLGLRKASAMTDEQQKKIEHDSKQAQKKVDDKAKEATTANAGDGSLLTRIEGAVREAGTEVRNALNRGLEQISIELDGLQRSVAVTYPLVEFVELRFKLKNSAAFLTDVIWSGEERKEQMKRTLSAAFGPLATFIGPGTSESTGTEVVPVASDGNQES